ncbi:CPBP family intramembrane glutamic endopeptidase [Natronomonas amylolytica]|uniref:CPBP family intramembrane glutamic endopeptidase n=1 Tax=Natronomonas amylolytica TaxID=3108498 RepID=UPI003008F036
MKWRKAGSSLLFGSMHLANYSGRLLPIVAGALMISIIGTIFGILYERTGNLAVPILVHAVYNVVLLLVSYATTTSL